MITRPNQVRVLLDANIVDQLAADTPLYEDMRRLCENGAVEVLISALQVKELEQTPCEERRRLLLEILSGLSSCVVPAPAAIWDVTDWDQSEWNQVVDLNAVADASLPITASQEIAAVVSENQSDVKKALDRVRKEGGSAVELWTYDDFKKRIVNLLAI